MGRALGSGAGVHVPHTLHTEPAASGPRPLAEQARARHLEALQRQLQVELKVKQGAENMTHTYASGTPKVRPPGGKRLCSQIIPEGSDPAPNLIGKCSLAIDPVRETLYP